MNCSACLSRGERNKLFGETLALIDINWAVNGQYVKSAARRKCDGFES
jgi:hypothetical protein